MKYILILVIVQTIAGQLLGKSCFSETDGFRAHLEEFTTFDGNWRVKCDNGTATITACIGSRRSGNAVIAIGETVTINRLWYRCALNGDSVKYEQEPSCTIHGVDHAMNATFRNGLFEMQCVSWGYDIIGCYFLSASGEAKLMSVDETVTDGVIQHECAQMPGTNQTKYSYKAIACEHNGSIHAIGEQWQSGFALNECMEYGSYRAIACVTKQGNTIEVGQQVVINATLHKCYRADNRTLYTVSPCKTCASGPITGNMIHTVGKPEETVEPPAVPSTSLQPISIKHTGRVRSAPKCVK